MLNQHFSQLKNSQVLISLSIARYKLDTIEIIIIKIILIIHRIVRRNKRISIVILLHVIVVVIVDVVPLDTKNISIPFEESTDGSLRSSNLVIIIPFEESTTSLMSRRF